VRRLAIILVGGALWLLLFAIPALADGGPHVKTNNNGTSGISADGCASCHRIHTSKSPTGFLLVSSESTITNYCRSCHGAAGTGASTDVDTGLQYAVGTTARNGGVVGALRSGGFVQARIGAGTAYRLVSSTGSVSNSKVPVGAAEPVTSAHLALGSADGMGGNGLTAKNVVWGNGALGTAGAGPTLKNEMECTTCHNPHGNGNYRILQSTPTFATADVVAPGTGAFTTSAVPAPVTDASSDYTKTRNYSVIQVKGTPGVESTYLLYADQVLQARTDGAFLGIAGDYSTSSGDYFHKNVPYDGSGTTQYDGPNARPNTSAASGAYNSADVAGFNVQMTNWCSQCHTRYMAASGSRSTVADGGNGTGGVDSIFSYRHTTAKNRTCSTCHVAHGTNAVMTPDGYSANVPFPDDSVTAGDSRLLKVDNRGTCQLCHDPTSGSAVVAPATTLAQGTTPAYVP
jgi:predicted CXXCH cytochrome family protein